MRVDRALDGSELLVTEIGDTASTGGWSRAIVSNFLLAETGELTDHQLGVLFAEHVPEEAS